MLARVPVLLCFDVEPDEKVIRGEADWAGLPALVDLLTRYREELAAATGAPCRFSWFLRMDPQVRELHGRADWPAAAFERELSVLRDAGDEFGLHVHPWRRSHDGWVAEFGDPAWVEHCVRSAFAAYQDCFGMPCRSFRFGDRWMDHATMRLIDSLDVRFDLTLEPEQKGFPIPADMDHHFLGERPDYTVVPRVPYRPRRDDYRVAGRAPDLMGITEIPISTAAAGTGIGTLYLANDSASICHHVDRLLENDATRHLALPARSDIAIRLDERRNLETILGHLLAHPRCSRLRFATPAEVQQPV